MDYECDVGYTRTDDGRCVFVEEEDTGEGNGKKTNSLKEVAGSLNEE